MVEGRGALRFAAAVMLTTDPACQQVCCAAVFYCLLLVCHRAAPDAHVPDTINLAGPAHISADAVSHPAAAAAAGEAAAAQRDSSGSQAAADESGEEEVTPQEMQAALSKQYEADQRAQQEAPVPDECRRDWRAAMRWALAVENGVDLLSPGYQEVLQAAQPRQISAPVPGINPRAIATQFLQQQQQAAAAAAAAQAQALAVGVGMPVPYQAVMLQQVQALQQQQQSLQQQGDLAGERANLLSRPGVGAPRC